MTRGLIIPVGIANEPEDLIPILNHFVSLCGGATSGVAVVVVACDMETTVPGLWQSLDECGAGEVVRLELQTRNDCENPELANSFEDIDGVILVGDNPLRLSTTIGGTILATALRRFNQHGGHVAGFRAAAPFLSAHMIAFGKDSNVPRRGQVSLAPGLGLSNSVIIDQYGGHSDSIGRLLTAMAYNPFACGIGLDAGTAGILDADNTFSVYGKGGLMILDPSNLDFTSMDQVEDNEPVCMIGVGLHLLTQGATFNIKTREAKRPS